MYTFHHNVYDYQNIYIKNKQIQRYFLLSFRTIIIMDKSYILSYTFSFH